MIEYQQLYLISTMPQSDLVKSVCVDDFKEAARLRWPKAVYQYIDSGSQDQKTLKQNRSSFHRLMIIPRILISTGLVDTSVQIFGQTLKLPFGFAPWAMNTICHPLGQTVPAQIAKQSGIIMSLSTLSTCTFTEVAKANQNGMRLMQMYITSDWELTKTIVKLAEKYKFTGLAITVDAQVLGIRKRQTKSVLDTTFIKFPVLEEIREQCKNCQHSNVERKSLLANRDLGLTWETIKKIRELTSLKIVLKGILHPKDAEIALNYCDAIWVSNHGGRQLNGVLPTIEVLPMIKAAVGDKIPIFVDGGIRTGNDIFKCLALGANYVFIGRPVAYSLVFGYQGVKKLVAILDDEFKRCMILTGPKSIKEIKPHFIVPEPTL